MSAGISQTTSSEILDNTNPNRREYPAIQKPKVLKLNLDILWRVFSLNAVGYRDDIATLRHTSQVCTSWRDLALSSSSLWGRVINVAALGLARDEWVKEVIRRTGRAPLHIQDTCEMGNALLVARRTAVITLLEDLLKHNWTRIKTVELFCIVLDFSQEPMFEELLQQPAPYLEVFHVCFSNPNPTFRLFANDAPSLNECNLFHIGFNTQAPWLRQVRRLHGCSPFSHPHLSMTPNQLLDVLRGMPLLETLHRLSWHILDSPDGMLSFQTIVLPRLTHIEVQSVDNVAVCVAVLRHIIPAPGCCLRVAFVGIRGFAFIPEEIAAFYAFVSQYLENYLKTHSISHFSIHTNPRRRSIFQVTAGDGFQFSLKLLSPVLFVHLFFSDENLRHFISLLDNAEVLRVTPHMLTYFLRLRNDNNCTILPRLRRLFLYIVSTNDWIEHQSISFFLKWRWEMGLPIDSIHLPLGYDRGNVHYDFSYLDQFTGLEVEWGNGAGRYTCGSGNPDQLIFPMK